MIGWWKQRCSGDAGLTLIELLVAMALMALIVPLTFPMLTETLKMGGKLSSQSAALDQLQLAANSVGRDARAADCVKLDLASPPAPGTEASASTLILTEQGDGGPVTVTYAVAGGTLTRSEGGGPAVTVAKGLTGDPAIFLLHPGNRQALEMDMHGDAGGSLPVAFRATITSRAAWQAC